MLFYAVAEYVVLEAISTDALVLFLKVVCNEDGVIDHKICEVHPLFVHMTFQITVILQDQFYDFLLLLCARNRGGRWGEEINRLSFN